MAYFLVGIGLFLALVIGGLVLLASKAQRLLEIEKGKTPLHHATAGGLVGGIRYKGPFLSLRVYDEFLVIGGIKPIILRFEEIDEVEISKWMGMVADGIKLIHHNPDAPAKIIIGATNPAKLKELIDSNRAPGGIAV